AERPVVLPSSLSTAGLKSVADMGQTLQPNGAPGALRSLNEGLRDHGVAVGLKPRLSSRELAQPSLGRLSAAGLKTGAPAQEMGADFCDRLAGVGFTVTVGCNVDDAEVDAEHIGRLDQFGIIDLACTTDVPPIPHNHRVDFALAEGKQSPLV